MCSDTFCLRYSNTYTSYSLIWIDMQRYIDSVTMTDVQVYIHVHTYIYANMNNFSHIKFHSNNFNMCHIPPDQITNHINPLSIY